jgi:hypothetical protein
MTKTAGILAALLGVSVVVNAFALVELGKARAKQPGTISAGKSRAPDAGSHGTSDAPVSADLSSIAAELKALRNDVAALREGKPAPAGGRPGIGDASHPGKGIDAGDLPDSITSDPAVAKLLKEQEALNKLWGDLGKLSQLQKSLGDEKHRQLVMKLTAEFLGLDASAKTGFETAANQMMAELDTAAKTMQEAYKQIPYDQKDPQAWQRHYEEVQKRYNESRKAAESRLDAYLTNSPRHEQFKTQLQTWGWYANPKQWGGDLSWAGGSYAVPAGDDE